MGSNSVQALGALGRDDILYFEPDALHIETRPGYPGYDRRHDRPLTEEFIANVREPGIISPIIIQRLDTKEGTLLLVRNGRQRVRTALEIKRRMRAEGVKDPSFRVPARRMRLDDRRGIQVQIATNEAVNVTTNLEKAEAALQLKDQHGFSLEETARTMCCDVGTLKQYIRLLDAAPAVLEAVSTGAIPVKVAAAVSRMPQEQQTAAVKEITRDGPVAGRKARERAAVVTGKDARTMRPKGKVAALLEKLEARGLKDCAKVARWILGEDVPEIEKLLKEG